MRDSLGSRMMKSQFVTMRQKLMKKATGEIESYDFQNYLDSKYKRIYRLK